MPTTRVPETVDIGGGVQMPMMGFGTWQIKDKTVLFDVLDAALWAGYRFIDTAAAYENEVYIADALEVLLPKYSLTREDIFITSKLRTVDHGAAKARAAALRSLQNLRTDYLDLYLIHAPGADPELRADSWLEMEKLKKEGKLRAIGVSNFMIPHLEDMSRHVTVWQPAVNQCEYQPHVQPNDLIKYCRQMGIHFQAYSSLGSPRGKGKLLSDPLVIEMARKYLAKEAQVLLAWALNQGISVLPRSTVPVHVKANYEALDITMDDEDIKTLASMNTTLCYP